MYVYININNTYKLQTFPYGDPEIGRTVGFHNFNLRILNLRVSNPNKSIVDVLFDAMSDFNVPGSRPKRTR